MALLTLTTDFGLRDWYVGTMKGIIAGTAPGVSVIDLTHGIPPGDVVAGAFALMAAAPYFPPGTVHVAVVDPGVGSDRQAIAIRTERAILIGPDNGLLSWAAESLGGALEVRRLENRDWSLPLSRTFHGRDLFAPFGARLAHGAPFQEVGAECEIRTPLPWPRPMREGGSLIGQRIASDHFGNVITNISRADLDALPEPHIVRVAGKVLPLRTHYGEVASGEPLAYFGSNGWLELAVRDGSFSLLWAEAAAGAIRVEAATAAVGRGLPAGKP